MYLNTQVYGILYKLCVKYISTLFIRIEHIAKKEAISESLDTLFS